MTTPQIPTEKVKITTSQKIALEHLTKEKARILEEHTAIQAQYNEIEGNLKTVTNEAIVLAGLDPEKVIVTSLDGDEISYVPQKEEEAEDSGKGFKK
jgi:hypothetical protein